MLGNIVGQLGLTTCGYPNARDMAIDMVSRGEGKAKKARLKGRANLANTQVMDRLAPYERRVIELLRNSKDKRARKLAKKRVRLHPTPTVPYPISLPPQSRNRFSKKHLWKVGVLGVMA